MSFLIDLSNEKFVFKNKDTILYIMHLFVYYLEEFARLRQSYYSYANVLNNLNLVE